MISREMIEEMFANMRANAGWSVDAPLLWGYFFTAYEKEKLEKAAGELVNDGYELVDIWQPEPEDEDEDPDLWWLHVQRVEHHTVDSLAERNAAFYTFASKHDLESYDGMDVGQAAS